MNCYGKAMINPPCSNCKSFKQRKCRGGDSCNHYVPKSMITNGERIRAKLQDDKVLAKYTIDSSCDGDVYWCSDGKMYCDHDDALEHELDWLRQPAEEVSHDRP